MIRLLLFNIVLLLIPTPVFSQDSNCENLGFELGVFTNWEGTTWNYSSRHPEITTDPVEGIVKRRHTIIKDNYAYDPNTGNELKLIPRGYYRSCRLGDAIINYELDPPGSRCWHQNLRYTMEIDEYNTLLILKFALVLQYAEGHLTIEEPRFRFTLYNQNGDKIPDCANYDLYATNEDVEGFKLYKPDSSKSGLIMWRDWTTVGVDLSGYTGQTITIEFMSADCTWKNHYGYAYFVASCLPLNITVGYCENDSTASLFAPVGFDSYSWTDNSETVIGTTRSLIIADPIEGAVYSCTMISATNCEVTLSSEIIRYSPNADFSSSMIDCNTNTVQINNNLSTTNNGSLSYLWDFGNRNTSTEINPQFTFSTSGLHQVNLSIRNPPSNCTKMLSKTVESFSPPLVGIDGHTTYCPGESIFLKAYGAHNYTWSTGSNADSIEVKAPGGEISLIGRSSTGCSDTNYITVNEEPDWEFLAEGDTVLCEGEYSILQVSGAIEYFWDTGDTNNTKEVSEPRSYRVTGKNSKGCKKTKTFNVVRSPPPPVDFVFLEDFLDIRNNNLSASIPSQSGVEYVWNMGDGSIEMGSSINHAYTISNEKLHYEVVLTATNEYDCINSSSQIIEVVPFVPNVFSPNGDGINDIFMPGLELQIIDRNGVLIYKGNEGWDGRYRGQALIPDTYFYSIYYTNLEEQPQHKKGCLTLVR